MNTGTAFMLGVAWGAASALFLSWLWATTGRSDRLEDILEPQTPDVEAWIHESEQDAIVRDIRIGREIMGGRWEDKEERPRGALRIMR